MDTPFTPDAEIIKQMEPAQVARLTALALAMPIALDDGPDETCRVAAKYARFIETGEVSA